MYAYIAMYSMSGLLGQHNDMSVLWKCEVK